MRGIGAVTKVSGDGQVGVVGDSIPVSVRVSDEAGNPVGGLSVSFAVEAGGGTATPARATSGADGAASTRWVLGDTAGVQQRLTVRVSTLDGSQQKSVDFTATARSGSPAATALVSGDGQTGALGATLPDSLVLRVTDEFGNPVASTAVAWTAIGGGSIADGGAQSTDAQGLSIARWTLGTRVDTAQVAQAVVAGLAPVKFTATGTVPASATLAIVGGDAQRGSVGSALSTPLAVALHLADGRPIRGAAVVWSASPGSGSVAPALSTTDTVGRATASWTLGDSSGTRRAAASVGVAGGDSLRASFTASATTAAIVPGRACDFRFSNATQTGPAGSKLPLPMSVAIYDSLGNPVPNATAQVRWSPRSGGQLQGSFATDATGQPLPVWVVLDTVAGVVELDRYGDHPCGWTAAFNSVAVGGVTITPAAPARVVATQGGGQSGLVGTKLATSLGVRVTDVYGNSTQPDTIVWHAAPGNGSVATAASGPGKGQLVDWTLGTNVGTQTVWAVLPGADSVKFTATASSSGPSNIVIAGGDGQTGHVGAWLPIPVAVKVTDAQGNPVSGVTVSWSGPRATFTLNPAGTSAVGDVTNADGISSEYWAAGYYGDTVGTYHAIAKIANGDSVVFTAKIVADTAAVITVVAGDGQSALKGTTLPTPLVVRLTDRYGVPIPGASIGWQVTLGGGSVSPASAVTDADGRASTSWTLGTTAGTNNVRATYRTLTAAAFTATGGDLAPPSGPLGAVSSASVGYDTGCAIGQDGYTYCWGKNDRGQLGVGATDTLVHAATPVAGGYRFTEVVPTYAGTCALTATSRVCWGGQFGSTPVAQNDGLTFVSFSSNGDDYCGLTADHTAYCWGADGNKLGLHGNGTVGATSAPSPVAGGYAFATISVGDDVVCGTTTDGAGLCWGNDAYRALGDTVQHADAACAPNKCSTTPVKVAGGHQWSVISASDTPCAIDVGGVAYCWGKNDYGSGGTGSSTNGSPPLITPQPVATSLRFSDIRGTGTNSCALATTAAIYCWGYNATFTTGTAATSPVLQPSAPISGGYSFAGLSLNNGAACGVTSDGATYCWGYDAYGQLGTGAKGASTYVPQRVLKQ